MSNEPHASPTTGSKTPVDNLPKQDHGAETLRNYRYQSAYAVVLLAAAVAGRNDYEAVWCEQEDDIMCEINSSLFDSFQVKTKTPELGHWRLTDEAFVTAVKNFLRLDKNYPGSIRHFHFVSNTELLDTTVKTSKHLCPKKLVDTVKARTSIADLPETEKKGFTALRNKTGGTESELWQVLTKLTFVKSPDRDAFIAELAQNHLRELSWCQLPQLRLEIIVRSLIEMVDSASSLSSQDGARHYPQNAADGKSDPQLLAKRITKAAFVLRSRDLATPTFRYLPSLTTNPLASTNKDLLRFTAKLERGGLADYADALRNQMLSSEAVFLDLATRGPEGAADLVQVENVVRAECDAAHLRAAQGKSPFGQRMLIDVQDRLRRIAADESGKVAKQPYEALMGMAAMLTEACPVWWSERFNLERQA